MSSRSPTAITQPAACRTRSRSIRHLALSPPTLPVPTVGNSYSQQLTASGGSGTGYVFSSGTLPPGLTLSPSGLLSGTPLAASGAIFTVDVTVTDSESGTGGLNYVLTVKAASQAATSCRRCRKLSTAKTSCSPRPSARPWPDRPR